jgi:hypothetical protein
VIVVELSIFHCLPYVGKDLTVAKIHFYNAIGKEKKKLTVKTE